MREVTPQNNFIFCLNNSPEPCGGTPDRFGAPRFDSRTFDSLDRGTAGYKGNAVVNTKISLPPVAGGAVVAVSLAIR